jgi:hypothetical protein
MKKKSRNIVLSFDRLLSKGSAKQMLILAGTLFTMFVVSFGALCLSGDDWVSYCHNKSISPWVFPLYLLIDANAFNDLYTNDVVSISKLTLFISGITFVAGILLFTGAFISILTNVISRRVDNHFNGLIPYLESGHYIIMGYDDMVSSIISNIFSKEPETYVLLLTAVDAKIIREKLRKSFSEKQMEQIIINYGLRTSQEFYSDIHLEDSNQIFIVGNRSLPAHDAMNVECIDSICSYLEAKKITGKQRTCHPNRITCIFEDLDTYAAFKTTEIFNRVGLLNIEFVPYNFYSGWAKQVLLARQYKEKSHPSEFYAYPSLYGNGIGPEDNKYVHLVFVGTTNLAVAFAMEAAHLLHFPNFNEVTKKQKTRITFIDINAEIEMTQFATRNRHFFEVQSYYYKDMTSDHNNEEDNPKRELLSKVFSENIAGSDFLDTEYEFVKGDVCSNYVQNEIKKWAVDKEQYLSIFLTLADQRKNFMMGMNMPDEVYDNEIPVFIRQDRSDNFVTNLRKTAANEKPQKYCHVVNDEVKKEERKGRYANIYPFGMCDTAYYIDETAIRRAKLINYLYSTADYSCNRFKDSTVLASMTDESIWREADKKWKELTVALKWSNLYNAYSIPCKMASLRVMRGLEHNDTSRDFDSFTKEEILKLATVEHNRWNVEKLLMGYRKAKPDEDKYEHTLLRNDKDAMGNKKLFIHHDIRPFGALDNVRQLDYEFVKYIPWILIKTK